mmetsp:Transcript_2039/g.2696  ORF Transcript_2039/g.2696 Transcript_2039/m.2696 type:complete len:208 (+) Transcript_2039:823-1446(+)
MIQNLNTSKNLLAPVDIGTAAYWWDYGQLKLYLKNAFQLIEDSSEAHLMREFLQVKCGQLSANDDQISAASAVHLGVTSKTAHSVLANIYVQHLEADRAIAVNCTAKRLILGKHALAYNILEPNELILADGEVCTDVFMPDGTKIRQRSRIDIDGGKQWKIQLDSNSFSFEQIYKTNLSTDVLQVAQTSSKAHTDLAASFDLTIHAD